MTSPPVLIVGAGPTGLMLALRLHAHGVRARIVDRNPGPGLASRAMAVHARTLELYAQLGLADAMVDAGVQVRTVHLREGGQEVARISLADMGEGLSPYPFMLAFPQDDHERLLVGELAARGVEVEWDTALESFTQDDTGVRAVLDRKGVRETCEAAYVCGCDGAHSRVRETIGLGFAGGVYEHLYYVADVRLRTPPGDDAFMNLGTDGFALMLPVRSSGMERLIGIAPDKPEGEITFEDVRPHAEPLLGVEVAEVNWFSTYRVHHRVAAAFRVGRAFLAGDAGHLHSPTGGQGMNTGIGDAANLAWKLAQVLRGRADPSLLDTYQDERQAFARALVSTTDRAFKAIVDKGPLGHVLRTFLLPHLAPFLTGFAGVRREMFRAVSQVRIDYEKSPLSAGRAGEVRGGDRLPWLDGPAGGNFAPLRSADWQIHVYGEPTPDFRDAVKALGVPLHVFAWSNAAAQAGFARDGAYLVRPDAYVALAMAERDAATLRAYLDMRPMLRRLAVG